jgi:hypothetical protein
MLWPHRAADNRVLCNMAWLSCQKAALTPAMLRLTHRPRPGLDVRRNRSGRAGSFGYIITLIISAAFTLVTDTFCKGTFH